MKKLIDVPNETVKQLKVKAKKKGWSVKQLIENIIIQEAQNDRENHKY